MRSARERNPNVLKTNKPIKSTGEQNGRRSILPQSKGQVS
jgi:hypothetical protein